MCVGGGGGGSGRLVVLSMSGRVDLQARAGDSGWWRVPGAGAPTVELGYGLEVCVAAFAEVLACRGKERKRPEEQPGAGGTGPLPDTAGRCAVEVGACSGRACRLARSQRRAGVRVAAAPRAHGRRLAAPRPGRVSCSSYKAFVARARNREVVGLGLNSAKRFG